MDSMSDEFNSFIRSTFFHSVFFILISFMLILSVIGASKFDETITDYTGHQLWRFVYGVIAGILPIYVILNWIDDILPLVKPSFIDGLKSTISFVNGGIKAIKNKKDDQ